MSNPELTPAQWLDVMKVPTSCLNPAVQSFLANNRGPMIAWCNGEAVEMAMGKVPNVIWYGIKEDKQSAIADSILRIAPKVTISATLTVKQANALFRVMEESNFNTDGGRKARNSIMKSIEIELQKAGH